MISRTHIFPYPEKDESLIDYAARLIRELQVMHEALVDEMGTYFEETYSWNPGSLSDGAGETSGDVSAPEATLGDYVSVSADQDLQGVLCFGYVKSAGLVNIRLQNETGGTVDLAGGTFRIRIKRAV